MGLTGEPGLPGESIRGQPGDKGEKGAAGPPVSMSYMAATRER